MDFADDHANLQSLLTSPLHASTITPAQPFQYAPQQHADSPTISQFDQFGLFGLLNIIRSADPSGTALALGTDLTTLGLNLNSPDALYASFISPFADSQACVSSTTGQLLDPEYHLPSCYMIHPLGGNGIAARLPNFADETLFYLFYAQPRDHAQELAAQELYARHWRFHRELQLWVTKDPGMDPFSKTAQYERGVFIFFDVARWEKTRREYTLWYSALEERQGNPPVLNTMHQQHGHPSLLSAITGNNASIRAPNPLAQFQSVPFSNVANIH